MPIHRPSQARWLLLVSVVALLAADGVQARTGLGPPSLFGQRREAAYLPDGNFDADGGELLHGLPGPSFTADGQLTPKELLDLGEQADRLLKHDDIAAIELYARQERLGLDSSLWRVGDALAADHVRRAAVLKHPLGQRLMVAWLGNHFWDEPGERLSVPLSEEHRESHDGPYVEELRQLPSHQGHWRDRLGASLYRVGRFDEADGVLRAETSPLAQWVKAKLALRRGAVDDAARLMKLARALPDASDRERLASEEALLLLARGSYAAALDVLVARHGYWPDAVHIAERVLTIEELTEWLAARPTPARCAPNNRRAPTVWPLHGGNGGEFSTFRSSYFGDTREANADGGVEYVKGGSSMERCTEDEGVDGDVERPPLQALRLILAKRLARQHRFDAALETLQPIARCEQRAIRALVRVQRAHDQVLSTENGPAAAHRRALAHETWLLVTEGRFTVSTDHLPDLEAFPELRWPDETDREELDCGGDPDCTVDAGGVMIAELLSPADERRRIARHAPSLRPHDSATARPLHEEATLIGRRREAADNWPGEGPFLPLLYCSAQWGMHSPWGIRPADPEPPSSAQSAELCLVLAKRHKALDFDTVLAINADGADGEEFPIDQDPQHTCWTPGLLINPIGPDPEHTIEQLRLRMKDFEAVVGFKVNAKGPLLLRPTVGLAVAITPPLLGTPDLFDVLSHADLVTLNLTDASEDQDVDDAIAAMDLMNQMANDIGLPFQIGFPTQATTLANGQRRFVSATALGRIVAHAHGLTMALDSSLPNAPSDSFPDAPGWFDHQTNELVADGCTGCVEVPASVSLRPDGVGLSSVVIENTGNVAVGVPDMVIHGGRARGSIDGFVFQGSKLRSTVARYIAPGQKLTAAWVRAQPDGRGGWIAPSVDVIP